jgi:hypothetical protein
VKGSEGVSVGSTGGREDGTDLSVRTGRSWLPGDKCKGVVCDEMTGCTMLPSEVPFLVCVSSLV